MYLSTIIIAAATCVSTASAHVALWDKGMFGFNYPYQASDPQNNNYNNNEPVIPLKQMDGRTTAQWFGHGLLGYPPKAGDFMNLPSGGTYNGEVSCNRGQTTLGNPSDTSAKYKYACKPDGGQYSGVGALHVMNTYNSTVDNKWFGGTALAIAYTSDVANLKPNDLTVISVNQNSVWERQISYKIPSGMPPCPSGGCLCSWNWIHQGGHGEGYPYEIGPKTPMYLWQADGNNLPNLDDPPLYRDNWGFADGAQNDIFQAAATPASSSAPKASATSLLSGWSSVGCMVDSTSSRALPGVSSTDTNNNTIQGCVSSCASKGYLFAGVEYGQECWCSNTATLTSAASTDCNMVCPGDIWSTCGGSSRINVYRSANAPTSGQPTPLPDSMLPSGWSSLGCMVDDQSNRALTGGSTSSSSNTVQSCIASCASKGFTYAGVEYGQECWCGKTARLTAASSGCDVACAGDGSHVCGGSNRLNVYVAKSATTSSSSSVKPSTTSTSVVKTTTSALSIKPSSSSSSVKPSTSSSTSKAPVSTSTSKAATTTSIKPSTTTSKATVTVTSTAPAATTSLPAGWVSRGCYVDSSSARVLDGNVFESKSDMTYASCISICTGKGYSYAGLEYGTQCYCGNNLVKPTQVTSGCDKPCAGDNKAMCGGFNRITVLQKSTVQARHAQEWKPRGGRRHHQVM
ncbi:hypothetical protein I302_108587 [Kwoniella bestiolae CBS 10118]|uniref:WSC domain-containing protein n=1 Tax=Kwoniella bestiolae CBS 10118 TaxID=1296100 RepID=A0AAJ8KG08_9TREE